MSDGSLHIILQEIKNGNKALSNKTDSKTEQLSESISVLKAMLDGLSARITEAEERNSTVEDHLAELGPSVSRLSMENVFLKEKVDQLENYSRHNICLINLREGSEGTDSVGFFTNWIPATLGLEHFMEPLIVERAHRTLGPRLPTDQKPRPVLIRLLNSRD